MLLNLWRTKYFYPRPPRGGRPCEAVCSHDRKISIHVLREEDDCGRSTNDPAIELFLSTSSARRTTRTLPDSTPPFLYFYPRPPRGGRQDLKKSLTEESSFLSTSSARRTTFSLVIHKGKTGISIHVLREEDDCACSDISGVGPRFLSTSSARRTTTMRHTAATRLVISIHVLREEDDLARMFPVLIRRNFYPRPPRGGRRADAADVGGKRAISIHVLREEDDDPMQEPADRRKEFLSTSSARRTTMTGTTGGALWLYFYPRPPRGGRLGDAEKANAALEFLSTSSARRTTFVNDCSCFFVQFLSTSSARRTTISAAPLPRGTRISIHVLREEDDPSMAKSLSLTPNFYPRPPRGGRPPRRRYTA